jgi:hypothetical protein
MTQPLKKITIPANGPGPHKEMAKRVKEKFEKYRSLIGLGIEKSPYTFVALEKDVLAIIKEYDIADAMRGFEGRDK